jgi:hypothetical protein
MKSLHLFHQTAYFCHLSCTAQHPTQRPALEMKMKMYMFMYIGLKTVPQVQGTVRVRGLNHKQKEMLLALALT